MRLWRMNLGLKTIRTIENVFEITIQWDILNEVRQENNETKDNRRKFIISKE